MSLRRELSKEVQTRLAAGESKIDIYNALKGKYSAAAVGRSLAQWPTQDAKEQYRTMNVPLLIIAALFALLQIMTLASTFEHLIPAQIAVAGLIIIIQLYTVYGIFNCNLIGYLLIVVLSVRNILGVLQVGLSDRNMAITLALSGVAIILAVIQKRKLFPNTSWLLHHKKDGAGNPIF